MPAPGDVLADRYRIGALLGSGGMATVHRAHDDRLDRFVLAAGDKAVNTTREDAVEAVRAGAAPNGVQAVCDTVGTVPLLEALIPTMRTWVTNEYEHNALRADGDRVLDRLLGLARGTTP